MVNLKSLFFQHVGQTSPKPLGIEIVDAEGVYLIDKNQKKYFDLIAGVSVANVGHKNKAIIDAVKSQSDKYLHIMVYGEFIEEPQVMYAKELTNLLPKNLNSCYFVNSGTEAIETAMKLAKRFTGRTEIISARNAYHGSSQGAMSLMSDSYFTAAYRPLIPEVKHIDFNCFDDLLRITNKTACVIIEPIQGEAGVISPKAEYLEALRLKCNQTGTLLIFDEIQTGFGRTGKLFAFQKYNIIPDVLVLAKALGAGLPLGAVIAENKTLNSFTNRPILGHISTFGGHPLSCAAGRQGLKYLFDNDLMKTVIEKETLFRENLTNCNNIKEIRSDGLLIAVDLGNSKKLFKLLPLLYSEGIHTDWFLFNDHSFRISPPLTISNEEINQACDKILNALKQI
jgi:acetylornithine/succinyldiaminopimelate/putrescine aminotransferase